MLGNDSRTDRTTPVQTGLTGGVVQVAAGSNSMALTSSGDVYAWGVYPGDGTYESLTPVHVTGLGSGVTGIASGGDQHDLALRSDGTVAAWGYNGYGQLGNGTEDTNGDLTPVAVLNLTDVVAVAAGEYFSMALRRDGSVWTWGDNDSGELGGGRQYTDAVVPRRVHGLPAGVVAIAAGASSGYALKRNGTVYAWGSNERGSLGDGTTDDRLTPVLVQGLSGVTAIGASGYHAFARLADGSFVGWGDNRYGQVVGDGSSGNDLVTPTPITGPSCAPTQLAAGREFTLVLCPNGSVESWGFNFRGGLGDGTTNSRTTPVPVQGLRSPAVALAAGTYHSLAITTDALPPDPPHPTVSISDGSTIEGTSGAKPLRPTTNLRFAVRLSHQYVLPVNVTVTPHDGSATAGYGQDYTWRARTLTVPSGARSAIFTVNVFPDSVPEPEETLTVVLSDPNNADIARGTATGTIIDDDRPPVG